MTTEQKAKAYDEAIERASKLRVQNPFDTVSQMMEHVFPELKESEDEKIRKVLKHYLEVRRCQTQSDEEYINCNNFLAWLEKQENSDTLIQEAYELGYTEGKRIERKHWIEKQNFSEDYNSIDPQFGKPINKVEPKFKVGDWCIDNEDGTIFQIVKVLDNTYTYKTNEDKEYSCSHYSLENDAHLWTIQSAKDGDVLACNEEILLFKSYSVQGRISLYCWYNGQTNNFHSKEVVDTLMTTRNKIYPATKEQRDILFQKMKEEGYEWDDDKKELKKIEQPELTEFEEAVKDMIDDYRDAIDAHAATTEEVKERAAYMLSLIPHKSAEWSKEDECTLNGILDDYKSMCKTYRNWLESLKNRIQPQQKQEWSEEDEEMFEYTISLLNYNLGCRKWLKSIKERYTWKPSNAQIRALEYIIDNAHNTSYSCKIAKELLEQLRKLKGE